MNNLNLVQRDYLEAKGNADHANEKHLEKQATIAELESDMAYAKEELAELKSRIGNANREMALGRLSSDQFMELKRETAEKETKINHLSEAIAAEKGALSIINDENKIFRREQHEHLKITANELSGKFADDVAGLAGDRIKDLAQALIVAKGKNTAFTLEERQRDMEAIYMEIGEALCSRVFQNETGSFNSLPDSFKARQHINELIYQTASLD